MYQTLIVDDRDIFILELKRLKVWGEGLGFEIAGKASDGVQALEMLRSNHYDLVITDIRMPRIDGIKLLQEIKKEKLCSCVVLLSEHSEFEYARRGIVLGAFDYLVKPAKEQEVSELLSRTKQFIDALEAQKSLEQGIAQKGRAMTSYPSVEEKNTVALIGKNDDQVVDLFLNTAKSILHMSGEEDSGCTVVIRRFYINIISEIFSHYSWLQLYLDESSYKEPDIDDYKNCADIYKESLYQLFDFVHRLIPREANGVLHNICHFILENPESEIKLSSVAEKFYINHTYLSNTFRQKTGHRFNDYVTSVRMARARFLVEHSELKIYEICNRLGYKDADYFNRLFKKYNSTTPTDIRKTFESNKS
ncbi:MAG: two component transcriptional regulator, AraC family [Oscillospiraceae bacterium]|nr:two component transcriptional regulator, AraC family [Oscillospiraceae bacterium]